MRYPFLVDLDQPVQALDQLLPVEGGQAGTLRRLVHAVHVHVRPEDPYFPVDAPVRLQTFEELRPLNSILLRFNADVVRFAYNELVNGLTSIA